MICPNCYNKIKKEKTVCDYCGFDVNELETASNMAVKKVKKEGRYDDVIYTTHFPQDLSYKKTLLTAVLGGWFGLHNFYINKIFKGFLNLLSLIAMLIFVAFDLNEASKVLSALEVYVFVLYIITLIMWVNDIVSLLLKKFKVPVVLKKNIKKEKTKNAK